MPLPESPAVLYARLLAKGRLRHLQLVIAVADLGSIKHAADHVGMSQPAATQALADLEEVLGIALFERHARGMRVSAHGRVMIPVLRQSLQALRVSAESLVALQQGFGLLRVGAIPAAAAGLLRRMAVAFCNEHPAIRLHISEDRGEHLIQELASGGLDLVLCRRPAVLPPQAQFLPVQGDAAIVLAGVKHPLLKRKHLSIDDLQRCTWMVAPAGLRVREMFDELFLAHGREPAIHPISTTSQALLVEILGDRKTIALVPSSLGLSLCQWGLVARLDVALGTRFDGLGVLCMPATLDNPVARDFIERLARLGSH